MTKPELRSRLRQVLRNLSPEQWAGASRDASRGLLEVVRAGGARTILFYMPIPGEVDISPAAVACLEQGLRVCLPRASWDDAAITPALVDRWGENLSTTRHGIRQPADSAPPVSLADLDLIVVPGLGFDASGGRLGRGGGFYDRFLSRPEIRAWKVGVGLDEQVVERVPRDAWDVPLDALVTPTRLLVFSPGFPGGAPRG